MLRSTATSKANEQKVRPLDADAKIDFKFARCERPGVGAPDAASGKRMKKPFRDRLIKA